MQCVILAGGLGTRMRAVAGDLPKALLPINGKPFIHYQLQWLKRSGISDVVLCIGYGGQRIRDYVDKGQAWNLPVRYVDEGEHLRGTGGALQLAGNEGALALTFFLMYGDSFLPIDFMPIWAYFDSRIESALMTVMHNKGQWDASNARFDGTRVALYDKRKAGDPDMDYIDYGLSILRRDPLLKALPKDRSSDLAAYFHDLSQAGMLAGYAVQQRFYEVGSPQGLADFKVFAGAPLAHLL